jgi:uncharacterized membrane protein
MMRGWGPGFGLLMSCLMVLLVIAVIALVVWLIVKLVRSSSSTPAQSALPPAPQPQIQQPDPVLETLRRRLAEGAITTEEFDELRLKLGV